MKSYSILFVLQFFCLSLFSIIQLPSDHVDTLSAQQVAEEVLNNLKAANGILSTESPSISVEQFNGGVKIAKMDFANGKILLDKRTYDHCKSTSAGHQNALSFIIGHELGHFIHAHRQTIHEVSSSSSRQAASVFAAGPRNTVNDTLQQRFSNALREYRGTYEEAEADLAGAFLGYLAGYKPMQAGEELLRKLYDDPIGGLKDTTGGYPSIDERIGIVRKTAEDLTKLTPLFETAKYLTAIGQYGDAAPLLEEVSRKFKSREIFNNIGVLHILSCLEHIKDPSAIISKYKFPILFDSDFRAPHPQFIEGIVSEIIVAENNSGVRFIEPCIKSDLQESLDVAEKYFNKALVSDKNYEKGYLNLSIAQAIKGALYFGFECREEKKLELTRAMTNAHTAKTIAMTKLKDRTLEHFQFIPTESKLAVSYPENGGLNPEIFDNYPYWVEIFGVGNESHIFDAESRTTLFSRWGPTDRRVPEAAVLLADIYCQIDIVRLLSHVNLSDTPITSIQVIGKNGFEGSYVPFSRSLELDPNNALAKKNRRLFRNEQNSTENESSVDCHSNTIIKPRDKNVIEIKDAIKESRWKAAAALDTSRFETFFKSGQIVDSEANKIFLRKVKSRSTLKYVDDEQFTMYFNQSDIGVDGRQETSIFMVPRSADTLSITDSTAVFKGMHMDSIQKIMGIPSREIKINNGRLVVKVTQCEINNYQIPRNDDTDAPGEIIRKNFGQRFIKIAPDVLLHPFLRIDGSEEIEHGIIFRIDVSNRLMGWVIYHRRIKTGAVDI